jgi:ubiquinone/menaquinone biosynthesis C-methylase UbiE
MPIKNYFLDPERARLYDESRPAFHAEVLSAFHETKPQMLYQNVLDVGCGTGQSSLALTEWSKHVMAIDSAEAMIDCAVKNQKISYLLADAENLPFSEAEFDLVFVASSLHWFEKRKFLNQVQKVLKSGGKFLVYDSFVSEGLSGEFSQAFSSRFPRPFQDVKYSQVELDFFDLSFIKLHTYKFETQMMAEDITKYFFNLSNVSAAIDRGESAEKALQDVHDLVKRHSTGSSYVFQVLLSEMVKR